LKNQIPVRNQTLLNRSAIAKTALVVCIIVLASFLRFPAANVGVEWLKDVDYHLSNNTTWLGMDSHQKIAWSVIPGYYLIALLMFYWFAYRTRRKTLYINKMDEGTLMYVHGVDKAKGNIYDMACILFNGFKNLDWKDVPKPLSKDYYENHVVIYYKTKAIVWPWRWKRLIIDAPSGLVVGTYSVWLNGEYDRTIPHPYNALLDYRIISNDLPYKTELPDHKQFEKYKRDMLNRIAVTNNTLLQGNPSIMGQSVKNNLTILTKARVNEEFEMLSDAEQLAVLLELHESSK